MCLTGSRGSQRAYHRKAPKRIKRGPPADCWCDPPRLGWRQVWQAIRVCSAGQAVTVVVDAGRAAGGALVQAAPTADCHHRTVIGVVCFSPHHQVGCWQRPDLIFCSKCGPGGRVGQRPRRGACGVCAAASALQPSRQPQRWCSGGSRLRLALK